LSSSAPLFTFFAHGYGARSFIYPGNGKLKPNYENWPALRARGDIRFQPATRYLLREGFTYDENV
jgi:hypothetical protein